jgi:acyl-CoA dehydrogenase
MVAAAALELEQTMSELPSFSIGDDYNEYRQSVARLCSSFPGKYWRDLEDQPPLGSYPTEFVKALTDAGYLAVLIPEEYGGAGKPVRAGTVILETIHRNGCSAGACHAQMLRWARSCAMEVTSRNGAICRK